MSNLGDIRHDWSESEILEILRMPFSDLISLSRNIHQKHFVDNEVQLCQLVNVKVGGCPENCCYCSQSAKYSTGVKAEKLMNKEDVMKVAEKCKNEGVTRLCMSAAWRDLKERDIDKIEDMIKSVKETGLETCATLGMIRKQEHADRLKKAGLDFYNHNIDTSKEYYHNIITTRKFEERLQTIEFVQNAGINVCCGGILGMGESEADRASMLTTLANLTQHPKSVPINRLVPIKGTPLENAEKIDNFDFIRMIATTRIVMPQSFVRLSAGRISMNREMQFLCFFAGANSIFVGDKLLTTDNPEKSEDEIMLQSMDMNVQVNKEKEPYLQDAG